MEVLKLVVYFSSFAQGFCIRLYGFCITVCVPKPHLCAVLLQCSVTAVLGTLTCKVISYYIVYAL